MTTPKIPRTNTKINDHTIAKNTESPGVVYAPSCKQKPNQPQHNHDRRAPASEGCKRNEARTLEALVEEPAQTAAEPQNHPSDTTSVHPLSAWADIDLPVSIWAVRNFKPIKRKRHTPQRPAGEPKNRSEGRRIKTSQEQPLKQATPSPTHQLIFPVLQIVPKTDGTSDKGE